MANNRNIITLGLMISSVILLVLLEGLWLYRSYEKEFFDFRRDANFHLRATLGELRDSILMENILPVPGDSSTEKIRRTLTRDSVITGIARIESRVHSLPEGHTNSNVRLYISTTSDSLQSDVLKPVMERIRELKNGRSQDRTFFIRINEDTLRRSLLALKYREKLDQHDIDLPATVQLEHQLQDETPFTPLKKKRRLFHMANPGGSSKPEVFTNAVVTDPEIYNPLFQYTATLTGVRLFLVRKLIPEILFSLFLTTLTCAAFFLVYRNLRRQQRLVQAKDDFISNVTHELKTPVATVSVALEALKNFNALDKRELTHEYLEIAQKELTRLSSLTDNILRSSVLEGVALIEKKEISLKTVAESATSAMKLLAESKKGVIVLTTEGSDFALHGSYEHLHNALINLLDNALKYCSNLPVITVQLTDCKDTIRLTVRDNGIGIDPAFHDKIFEKFFRVPKGNIHAVKGHGLGLNYVHSVVNLHQGTISVTSAPEKGSEFVLTLPKRN